jgi:hypothetical protein
LNVDSGVCEQFFCKKNNDCQKYDNTRVCNIHFGIFYCKINYEPNDDNFECKYLQSFSQYIRPDLNYLYILLIIIPIAICVIVYLIQYQRRRRHLTNRTIAVQTVRVIEPPTHPNTIPSAPPAYSRWVWFEIPTIIIPAGQNPKTKIPTSTKSQRKRFIIPAGQNPNRYKIPTKTHKLRQKLTFYILVANINFLLSQFNLI